MTDAEVLRRWRLRLARWIYPWWTEAEIDSVKWRAHQQRKALGLVLCVEARTAEDPAFVMPDITEDHCDCGKPYMHPEACTTDDNAEQEAP